MQVSLRACSVPAAVQSAVVRIKYRQLCRWFRGQIRTLKHSWPTGSLSHRAAALGNFPELR